MNKFLERENLMDSQGNVCLKKVIDIADCEADFFWSQFIAVYDDEAELADAVETLLTMYLGDHMKGLYCSFACMKNNGMVLPPHLLTVAAFEQSDFSVFYFGEFFLRLVWNLYETLTELDMEDFFFKWQME